MMDVVDLGSSELSEENVVLAQCKGAPVADDEAPDYGKVPLMCALGLAARPAPATSDGSAQGIVTDGIPGFEAACIGAFDQRSADTYKLLGPGETAVFSTGEGYDSRLLCKDQQLAMIVGNDTVIGINRKSKKISITGFGATIQLSADGGIVLAQGGAAIVIKDGVISLRGTVVLGGANPAASVMTAGATGPTPAPGVFVGV